MNRSAIVDVLPTLFGLAFNTSVFILVPPRFVLHKTHLSPVRLRNISIIAPLPAVNRILAVDCHCQYDEHSPRRRLWRFTSGMRGEYGCTRFSMTGGESIRSIAIKLRLVRPLGIVVCIAATSALFFALCFASEAANDTLPPCGEIVFSAFRGGNSDIYVIRADGTGLTRVTSGSTRELEPSWSPDGSRIAYQSQRPSWSLYVSLASGEGEVQLTTRLSWSPSWSPDGESLVYATGDTIQKISLTDGESQVLTTGGNNGRPSWAPNGQVVAFHSTRSGNSEIYVLDLESGELTQLTNHAGRDLHVAWAPDGQSLAFSSSRDGNLEIYTMLVDGSELARVTNCDADDMLPSWSPDGKWIAFVSRRDGNAEIYLVRPDGSDLLRLTDNPGDDMYPSWKPVADE